MTNSAECTIRKKKRQFFLFSFVPLFLCFLLPLIFFKFPLYATASLNPIANHFTYQAMMMALLWFVILGVTIIFFPLKSNSKLRTWSNEKLFSLMILFTVLGFVYHVLTFITKYPLTIKELVLPLSMMPAVVCIMGIYMMRNKIAFQKTGMVVLLLINFLLFYLTPLLHGSCYETTYSFIALMFAFSVIVKNRQQSIIFIFICLGLIASSMVLKNYMRFGSKEYEMFQVYRHNQVFWKDTKWLKYPTYIVTRIVCRLDHLSEFAYVIKKTPSQIPFVYGETYKPLAYLFIPRLIWHNKPTITIGQWYGHRYQFIRNDDHITNWAITLPIEGWVNFGWVGLILSAFLLGLLLNCLWAFFAGEQAGLGNIILISMIVYNVAQGETSASFVVGAMIHNLLFYWVLDMMVRRFVCHSSRELSYATN